MGITFIGNPYEYGTLAKQHCGVNNCTDFNCGDFSCTSHHCTGFTTSSTTSVEDSDDDW